MLFLFVYILHRLDPEPDDDAQGGTQTFQGNTKQMDVENNANNSVYKPTV